MHAYTRTVLLDAARRALQQNVSGNLAAHIPATLEDMKASLLEGDHKNLVVKQVEQELRILGLLGSGNGGYIGEGLTIQRVGEEPKPFQTMGLIEDQE